MNPAKCIFPLLAAVLVGCGPAAEDPLDPEQTVAADPAEPASMVDSSRYAGRFSYMADAAMFEDCRSGKRFPVSQEGAYIELERAYLNSGIEPGQPITVEISGRFQERPSMEGNHNIIKVIIDSFIGFSDEKSCTAPYDEPLRNTYWKLIDAGGQRAVSHEDRREAHMILSEAENEVRGHGGCNRFSGGFELHGESLTFGPLIMTEMACIEGMETELAFLAALAETDRFQVKGQILELYRGEELLARFEATYLR